MEIKCSWTLNLALHYNQQFFQTSAAYICEEDSHIRELLNSPVGQRAVFCLTLDVSMFSSSPTPKSSLSRWSKPSATVWVCVHPLILYVELLASKAIMLGSGLWELMESRVNKIALVPYNPE